MSEDRSVVAAVWLVEVGLTILRAIRSNQRGIEVERPNLYLTIVIVRFLPGLVLALVRNEKALVAGAFPLVMKAHLNVLHFSQAAG